MATCLPAHDVGAENVLRYQPMPAGKNPPGPPVGFVAAIGPAMLQSCGRSTPVQAVSLKLAASASGGSDWSNFHPKSKSSRCCDCAWLIDAVATIRMRQKAV